MPITSLHRETNRWLTSFGDDAKPGDEITWSVGHPLFGGEFTTIRLGQPVAADERGWPLFDENDADVWVDHGWRREDGAWATRAEIAAAIDAATFDDGLKLHGRTYKRTGFGNWREVQQVEAA